MTAAEEHTRWRNEQSLVGFVKNRGDAWRYRASEQWVRPNFYEGAIPPQDVEDRLLSWEPLPSPLYVRDPRGGNLIQVPERQAILRSTDGETPVLGIFSNSYTPQSYREWLANDVSKLLKDGLFIAGAALLQEGRIVVVNVEPEDNVLTEDGLEFRPGLMAATSLDGSIASSVIRTIRLVSHDVNVSVTLGDPNKGATIKRFRPSSGTEAHELAKRAADEFSKEVHKWSRVEVTAEHWRNFLDAQCRPRSGSKMAQSMASSKRETLEMLWREDPSIAPFAHTVFGVLFVSAVYQQMHSITRSMCKGERNLLNTVKGKVYQSDRETLMFLMSLLKLS